MSTTALRGITTDDVRAFVTAHELPEPAGAPRRSPAGMVGNTPVLWIGEPLSPAGRGFWAKLEGCNPGGIKDRPGLHMVAACAAAVAALARTGCLQSAGAQPVAEAAAAR